MLDNATYMPKEHIQKEKEYGIPWRSAFKRELYAMAEQIHMHFIGGSFPDDDEPFIFFHRIIKKEVLDAATYDHQSQADFLSMTVENLEIIEKTVY